MRHFFEWFAQHGQARRPWLVLGKGPSFGLRTRIDLSGYQLLSLNHAVREQPVLLAHLIDLDVVEACADALLHHARYVVLPWYPHVDNAPGARSLEDLLPANELLGRLSGEGRLLWYDLSIAPLRHGPGPVVQASFFSAEAAVSLLALAGARRIRSLGVDGGAGYSADFQDLEGRTLLANGQPGFDLQFQGIARTILQTGVDFAPLDHPSPVVVCIHSPESSALPDRVLEFTLRKHASISVGVHAIRSAKDVEKVPPAVVEEEGLAGDHRCCRAVLMAPGSLVFDDLRKLWTRPMQGEAIEVPHAPEAPRGIAATAAAVVTAATPGRLAEMCAALERPRGSDGLTRPTGADRIVACLPASWNRHDRLDEGPTSVLLYAAPGLQPWISRAHPLAHVWVAALLEAVREGFIPMELIRREVGLGHVRPSLLEQVDRGKTESLLVSWKARRRDARFTPPGGFPARRAGLLTDPLLVLRALARHARGQVRAYRRRTRRPA
jgi:hypothetical protein